jgi:hypothetical protein
MDCSTLEMCWVSMAWDPFLRYLQLASARVNDVFTALIVLMFQIMSTPRGLQTPVFATRCMAYWVVY